MKVQGAKKVHYDSGPNMTPLVDVVMVILIFLMLAGSFAANQRYLMSDIPIGTNGSGGPQDKPNGPIPTRLDVRLSQRALPYACTIGPSEAHNFKGVQALFTEQVERFKASSIDPETVQVTIFPTQDVRLDNLLKVYQAALTSGFKKVGFGVQQ